MYFKKAGIMNFFIIVNNFYLLCNVKLGQIIKCNLFRHYIKCHVKIYDIYVSYTCTYMKFFYHKSKYKKKKKAISICTVYFMKSIIKIKNAFASLF